MVKIGAPVIWIDAYKQEHNALITNVFGEVVVVQQMQDGKLVDVTHYPCINLVLVSADNTKIDGYGRQLERYTSAVHISQNSAQAMCWKLPTE